MGGSQMSWPRSPDYFEALLRTGECFDDQDLRRGEVVADGPGGPVARVGRTADVFRV
jgi:hypothetical protein